MKGIALTGIYMASIGLIVLAVEQEYIPEAQAGLLYFLWALVGLATVVVAVARAKD